MNQKEVITLFTESMTKHNKEYKVVWSRDMKFAKKFLSSVEDLSNNDKKELIDIVVENYDRWSTNKQYKLTVNTLSIEWIQQKAREQLLCRKGQESRMEEQSVEAVETRKIALESIMSRIKRKGGNP